MYKFLLLLLFATAASYAYGQTDSLSKEDKRLLDSMFNNDEFIKLMMGKRDKSYLDVNIGLRNGIFSLKNNALNAGQAQTNKLYYEPSVGYYHKSGLALSLSGFLANGNGGLKLYQYAISPSYMYSNKKFAAGISYTRFIEGSDAGFEISPFKNDFYTNAVYKKSWVQPGISLGYSFGKLVDYYDSSFLVLNRVVYIRDTATTKIRGLSVNISATHPWSFYELLDKKDALKLQPTLMLNGSSQKFRTTHSSKLINRFPRVKNYFKRIYCDSCASENFKLQSLALLIQAGYYYGKFYLQPQIYFDYYLPATTEKRLTSLFSVTAGFSFD